MISKSAESLLSCFVGSLVTVIFFVLLFFLKAFWQFVFSLLYFSFFQGVLVVFVSLSLPQSNDAYNTVLPLLCCSFLFSSETITISFPEFNYFHCSKTRAQGPACSLFFIQWQSFSWWHTYPPIATEDKKIVFFVNEKQ